MTPSSEVISLPAALRKTLSESMPDALLVEENLLDDCLPVVLMLNTFAVHAFAVGAETDYQLLYGAFKKYYLGKGPEWATKDVSFVFCLPRDEQVSETFFSKVEVDVYFCRKYVVRLDDDLSQNLARLPFLPLAPVSSAPIRPPSAKVLLRQRSMKAELANNLVQPGTGAATILENCLSGRFGPVHAVDERSETASAEIKNDQREQAVLKSISIENFRAYRKKKEFALGSAITVLYGPNGFGKTSFFDAIDFVVTGGVGRFDGRTGSLIKLAKHLDCRDDEQTSVSLVFQRAGKEHVIRRNLSNPNDAFLDGKATQRKAILSHLTGSEPNPADRVDSLVSLFRATHLFSQDQQELTGEVAANCALPADIVSRMLAFDDYVNGLKKVAEVLKHARNELARATTNAKSARDQIADDTAEVERLKGLLIAESSPEVLNEKFAELEFALSNASIELGDISVRDTRALRSRLEGALAEIGARRKSLDQALGHAVTLRPSKEEVELLNAQVEAARLQLVASDSEVARLTPLVSQATNESESIAATEKTERNRHDWLNWAVSEKPVIDDLIAQCDSYSSRMAILAQQLIIQRNELTPLDVAIAGATASLEMSEHEYAMRVANHGRVRHAQSVIPTLLSTRSQVFAAQKRITEAQQELFENADRSRDVGSEVVTSEVNVARLDAQVTAAKASEGKINSLIAELRANVQGSECLLCGHDHGSTQALLDAIDEKMHHGEKFSALASSLMHERQKLLELQARLGLLQVERRSIELRSDAEKSSLQELDKTMQACTEAFAAAGISLDGDVNVAIATALSRAENEERRIADAVVAARQWQSKAQDDVSRARQSYAKIEEEQKSVSTAYEQTKARRDQSLASAQKGRINFSLSLDDLQKMLSDQAAIVAETAERVRLAVAVANDLQAQLAASKEISNTRQSDYQEVLRRHSASLAKVQSSLSFLSALGFSADIDENVVLDLIQQVEAQSLNVSRLRDRAAELEVAADAVATSAAFQSIHTRIESSEKIAKDAEGRIALVEPWVKYFEGGVEVTQWSASVSHRALYDGVWTTHGGDSASFEARLRLPRYISYQQRFRY